MCPVISEYATFPTFDHLCRHHCSVFPPHASLLSTDRQLSLHASLSQSADKASSHASLLRALPLRLLFPPEFFYENGYPPLPLSDRLAFRFLHRSV